jgi:hypothetical protein
MRAALLLPLLATHPELETSSISRFELLCLHLKAHLQWSQPAHEIHPPHVLPSNIRAFLREALSISDPACMTMWDAMKNDIWSRSDRPEVGEPEVKLFHQYGLNNGIGVSTMTSSPILLLKIMYG